MTIKKEILKEINRNPKAAKKALDNLYHNRTYVMYTDLSNSVRLEGYKKTRRGAEGHIKRQQGISWYDDYTHEMVTAGAGLEIMEIQAEEIEDPTKNKKTWYQYLKGIWSKDFLLSNIAREADSIITDQELLKWVKDTVKYIQENNHFSIDRELEDIEDLEQILGSPEYYAKEERDKNELIKKGVERIKGAGRINTGDFEDIIEDLKSYGLNFVDAQNTITESYIQQLEQEEKQETPKKKEAQTKTTPETSEKSQIWNELIRSEVKVKPEHKESQEEVLETSKKEDNPINEVNTGIEISFNEEKNGIEIKFDGKPERAVLENLKANGFRWSRYQKIWYAKDTEERREFIKSFDAVETESEPKIFEYPEIDIDDIEDYTIDPDISRRENQGNWIFRSKETDHTQELQATLQHYQDETIKIIAKTEDKEIIYKLQRDLQRFKKSYHTNYTKMITNKANNPSWAVTGRAGRNANKDRKANDRYNNLIQESIKIVDDFTNTLNRADDKIRRISRKENYKKIENTEMELDFKVETKEIDMAGVKQSLRTYNHNSYMIVKAWGCFRIFKDGKEIKSMRTTDTLKTAKKALQLIINEENQDIQKAI